MRVCCAVEWAEEEEAATAMGSKPVKLEETVAKKLAMWHTCTFRPIMTHNELEPLMAAFGFVALPFAPPPPPLPAAAGRTATAVQLLSSGRSTRRGRRRRCAAGYRPWLRLPYPRIDGLHLMTYKALFWALEFYHRPTLVPNLFPVR